MTIPDRIVVAVCPDCARLVAVSKAEKPRPPKSVCPFCAGGAVVSVRYQLVARAVPSPPRTVGKPRAQG